jgi:CubicO group peptidase (beta-lactamase class C family)
VPARRLIAVALAALATPLAAQTSAEETARRMAAFPLSRAVEAVDAYQPAETVRGAPRPLPLARTNAVPAAALASAQAYADAQDSLALVVLRDGRLAYEHYAPGFTANSRFSTASMHKTVMAAALGTAGIPLDAPAERWLTEWRGDPRGRITVRQLLTMSSGLAAPPFAMDPASPSMQLMFGPDIAATALATPLAGTPGQAFAYSNVNSQLAGLILERATGQRYARLLSKRIWRPIGGSDAALWLDRPGGTPHYFCCLQATARDWARFGQLLLDRGRVRGRQVIPAAWVRAMAAPGATNPNYGLQLWRGSPYAEVRRYGPSIPLTVKSARPFLRDDVLFLDGATGQRVYIVPSERLVIVRIGRAAPNWDDSELPNRILAAL